MKNINIYRALALFAAAIIIFSACTKETADVRLDPQLSTSQVLNVKADSATVLGFIIAAGDGFSERGVCYDKAAAPTTDKSKVVYNGQRSSATFKVKIGGLSYATKYYARAYVVNENGTIYGEEVNFTTLPVMATITTTAATEITGTTATTGGNITIDGGSAITARGVCYGKNHNPNITGSITTDGTGTGEFTSHLSKLDGLTTYYVRAYATNSVGTKYGNEVSFTTLVSLRNWYVPGGYVEASYPGSGLLNWAPDKSPMVKSNEAAPDNVEGYVYMAGASNDWKISAQPSWTGTNYGASGTAGVLSSDPGAGNLNLPAGYYKINVNAGVNPLTYTAIATVWGVIGDATPTGWGGQTDMTYNPASQTFSLALHLTSGGGFKFRGTSDWSVNYGSKTADGKLDTQNDNNIPCTLTADYAITLDLSHPLEYTYSANAWGIIGNATAGGWDNDQDMTWDAVNGVFTATIPMTAGEWKFRANNAWTINFGGSLTALTQDGGNFAIATSGNYTITLNPWTRVGTITMN
jgi:hypothetical protein